ERLGRDLGPRYQVTAMAPMPNGDELAGDGWATGQGGTMAPLTPARLHIFAKRLIDAQLASPPYRAQPPHPGEEWVRDGATELIAWRAVAYAGLADGAALARDMATDYIKNVSGQSLGTLEEPDPNGDPTTLANLGAPFALVALEQTLAPRGAG